MAKAMNLKCTVSTLTNFFEADTLCKAKLLDNGVVVVKDKYGVWHPMSNSEKLYIMGEDSNGATLNAQFLQLKTKTLKCTGLDHSNSTPKSFKVGKRYQVESGRALSSVAGYIYDDEGARWTLYREDVGFSCAIATFEAKYL